MDRARHGAAASCTRTWQHRSASAQINTAQKHAWDLMIKTVMSNLVQCFLCQSFKGTTFAAVVRHIGSVHAHEPGFSISCGIKDFPRRSTRPYNNLASYKKHLYWHHPDVLNHTIQPLVADSDGVQDADPELHQFIHVMIFQIHQSSMSMIYKNENN